MAQKLQVAVLGSGNIGTDLLVKLLRSERLECTLFLGRNPDSPGMRTARELGVRTSARGIQALVEEPDSCALVFDATSAREHLKHWPILQGLGKRVIDMTPSRVGVMVVPAIDLKEARTAGNVNMVSCGGQTSIPIAVALSRSQPGIEYIEVVSSIASRSAGPATRLNIDEYVLTTGEALRQFTGCPGTKCILILNPAEPPIYMTTTISAMVSSVDLDRVRVEVDAMVTRIRRYVPGYEVIVPPVFEQNRVVVMVKVAGLGDYLPTYAGNLDIINCAAIATAEDFAEEVRTGDEDSDP